MHGIDVHYAWTHLSDIRQNVKEKVDTKVCISIAISVEDRNLEVGKAQIAQ